MRRLFPPARGDYILLSGKFNRSCPMHGGDLDIHAKKIISIEQGELKSSKIDARQKRALVYLSGILLCLLLIRVISRKKQSRQ
ncbi:MAG: hypothetical protein COV72_04320 [Candidatus Omnitrophica bacterium CG11_big_fil_rev_8_21_14_0_20_42_13]|uniref:Uncharacterized protein n=1 Tax=Candidatus Ghiorseimicrobium undicola TaxID=1974746 RepID=A0A2H0LXR1_9BACT|nr:MAG: hypothetical protein COV72_04320 [Candidatus Omnitrophica bacterium CG11_big_fil_rev_8_21_14_0_20_42_13]